MVLLLLSLLDQIPGSRVQKCCYALDNMSQEYETDQRQQHDLEVMNRTINFALPVDSALPSPQGRDKQRGKPASHGGALCISTAANTACADLYHPIFLPQVVG